MSGEYTSKHKCAKLNYTEKSLSRRKKARDFLRIKPDRAYFKYIFKTKGIKAKAVKKRKKAFF